jgi:hypothetical protein
MADLTPAERERLRNPVVRIDSDTLDALQKEIASLRAMCSDRLARAEAAEDALLSAVSRLSAGALSAQGAGDAGEGGPCRGCGSAWTAKAEDIAWTSERHDLGAAECPRCLMPALVTLDPPPARGDAAPPEAPHFFDKRAADALACEVQKLIDRKVIDARSPAADALLDYVDPGPNESVPAKLAAAPPEASARDAGEATGEWAAREVERFTPPQGGSRSEERVLVALARHFRALAAASPATERTAEPRFCDYEGCDQAPLADGFCELGPGHDGRAAPSPSRPEPQTERDPTGESPDLRTDPRAVLCSEHNVLLYPGELCRECLPAPSPSRETRDAGCSAFCSWPDAGCHHPNCRRMERLPSGGSDGNKSKEGA